MTKSIEGLSVVDKPLAATFRLDGVAPHLALQGFQGSHPAVPDVNPDYVFRLPVVRDLLAFWTSGHNALKIQGDPATGKTSQVNEWHARLGWPLHIVSCNRNTTATDLIGGLVPMVDGTLKWVDGPVLAAARNGTSVLLDEFNTMEPGEATGLNALLEGYPFTVVQTNEVVKPESGFRVFATENSVNSRLAVTGRNVQDVANDDRWMICFADYLPEHDEVALVLKVLKASMTDTNAAEELARAFVKIANQVRQAYRAGTPGEVDKPMSTRSLLRWANLMPRFKAVPAEVGGPVVYSLTRAFPMTPQMSEVVTGWAKAKFGA